MTDQLAVIILTFNEEKNIGACLDSLLPLGAEVWIVDSGSTDATLDICRGYTTKIFHHPFENYGRQRNWALDNLPITAAWLLNVDADHRLMPELCAEIRQTLQQPEAAGINGFLASRRTLFMDKWIKRGGQYPTYHAILFRKGFGRCEDKLYDQHFKVEGQVERLKNDVIDIITDSLNTFINRHNHWATLEATYQLTKPATDEHEAGIIRPNLFGNPIQRRRYLKNRYESLPLFVRPLLYFCYRYFFKLGFLDGKAGLIFHFFQGFWFRFLIDAKIYELRKQTKGVADE